MPEPQQVTAILAYEDIDSAHEFLVGTFGLEPGRIDRDGEGRAVHGEVSVGGQVIWLHRSTPEHGVVSPRGREATNGGLAITVADVDAHHERSREAGATIEHPPADQPYGRREYGARDCDGHRWWFGSAL